jgi:catalase
MSCRSPRVSATRPRRSPKADPPPIPPPSPPFGADPSPRQKTDVNLKVGERGPTILNDVHLREKISKFDHERIPERVVHARGAAAHGVFKLHTAIPELSRAGILTDTARTTPVFLRFSTVAGSRGSADTVRDVRGFALRFYTDEGNWDIVGNSEWRHARGLMEGWLMG